MFDIGLVVFVKIFVFWGDVFYVGGCDLVGMMFDLVKWVLFVFYDLGDIGFLFDGWCCF